MTNNTALLRSMAIYAVCLPLAIVVGYMVSDPRDYTTEVTLTTILFLLILPLLLRWYHAWTIATWNMALVFTSLPGLLPGWMPVACLGFMVAIGHYILNRDRKFLPTGSVSLPLVVLAIVVVITAEFRGGLGFHVLGNDAIGGKRYLWIWIGILGYFVLISQKIPVEKRQWYTALFILGALTQAIGELASYLGPAFHFVYIFFPTDISTATQASVVGPEVIERLGGVAGAGAALAFAMVACYGVEGVLNFKRIWRPVVFFGALLLTTFGGYRSIVITVGLTFVLVFFFEGLLRSRLMPLMVLGLILVGGLTVSFSDRLPLSFQRCLAFLPVKIDNSVRLNAEGSSEWRLEIWRSLLPQVPQYLLLGKGLTFDANTMESYVTLGGNQVGGEVGGGFALAGDYHSGPLSLIIPFGIWGCIAFLWFLIASLKVLWANYKYGDSDLHKINTFFFCYFIVKIIIFFFVFGGFYTDVAVFAGLIGFNISLNGGVAARAPVTRPQAVPMRLRSRLLERPA